MCFSRGRTAVSRFNKYIYISSGSDFLSRFPLFLPPPLFFSLKVYSHIGLHWHHQVEKKERVTARFVFLYVTPSLDRLGLVFSAFIIIIIITIIIYPLTARVVGATQMILQPVSSILSIKTAKTCNCRNHGTFIVTAWPEPKPHVGPIDIRQFKKNNSYLGPHIDIRQLKKNSYVGPLTDIR